MSRGYKVNNLVLDHNKKYPRITSVDPEERYDRVFGFMVRTSHQYAAARQVRWYEEFVKDDSPYVKENKKRFMEDIKRYKDNLDEAIERRIYLTHKVLKEMSEGVINTITQGIWLSYPHTTEVVKIDEHKDKYIILTLCTGEKFYAYKKWIEYDTPRGRYDYFKQRWITKKPIHKQFYSKLKILRKL